MLWIVGGAFVWVLIAVLGLFAGRNEPTYHGQSVFAQLTMAVGFCAACAIWLTGFLVWLL